jgi:hypothetical protein
MEPEFGVNFQHDRYSELHQVGEAAPRKLLLREEPRVPKGAAYSRSEENSTPKSGRAQGSRQLGGWYQTDTILGLCRLPTQWQWCESKGGFLGAREGAFKERDAYPVGQQSRPRTLISRRALMLPMIRTAFHYRKDNLLRTIPRDIHKVLATKDRPAGGFRTDLTLVLSLQ